MSGEHAPMAAIFTAPHSPLRIRVRFPRRVFEQHWRPIARRDNSVGIRICLGENCGFTGTTHDGRNVGLLSWRYMFLLDVTAGGTQ